MSGSPEYNKKLISLQEAVGRIQSHQTVCVAMAGSEPPGLLAALAGERDRLKDVTLWTCLPMRAYDVLLKPEMEGHFFNENWFYGAADRKVHPEGRVSYTPNNLHLASADKLYATRNHVDVFIGTATPPDKRGFMSLSQIGRAHV